MSDGERNFCVKCGRSLPQGSSFCPECGASVNGDVNPYSQQYQPNRANAGMLTMDNLYVFILIYGIIALLMALMMLLAGFVLTPEVWQELMSMLPPEEAAIYDDYDLNMLSNLMFITGGILLVSSITAIVSAILIKKRENWKMAIALCVVAALTSIIMDVVIGIVLCTVGLFMAYNIYKNKDCFNS